jgi:signal transduction histidine kinase
MDCEENKRIAKEWHESFYSGHLPEKYEKYLHPDFTSDYFGQKVNRAQYITMAEKSAEMFSDSKIVVLEQVAEGDKVVSMIAWTAVHFADTLGIPMAGTSINIRGVAVDHFKNGKIIVHYPLFDTAQLVKRSAIREKVRSRIARDLHDNIGSTLGSVSYYSEMAQQFVPKKQKQLTMLLKKIEEASHELIEEMSDIVWAVNPANDSFEKLTLRMKNYAGDLLASRNIRFSFDTNYVSELLSLTIDQRKNIFLIFKESVYNAVKYSGCSGFAATISQADQILNMSLADNGKGFDVNHNGSYNGNGINNMKRRAEEIKAEFFISSVTGNGTRIQLNVPLKSSDNVPSRFIPQQQGNTST